MLVLCSCQYGHACPSTTSFAPFAARHPANVDLIPENPLVEYRPLKIIYHGSRTASHDIGRSICAPDSSCCQPCVSPQAALHPLARSTARFRKAASSAHAFPVTVQQVYCPPLLKTKHPHALSCRNRSALARWPRIISRKRRYTTWGKRVSA